MFSAVIWSLVSAFLLLLSLLILPLSHQGFAVEAVNQATEHNQALPPTQTGARVYCPKRGFTSEKKADKLRLKALSGS